MDESNEVRPFNCQDCKLLQTNIHLKTDEHQKFIDEYEKIAQERKN